MNIENIETPAVVIDLDVAENNLHAYQIYCDEHKLDLRPHIKTHKLTSFAKAQIDCGAVGITCQKIGEAEIMAAAGIENILITYNILGDLKLARLRALHDQITLSVTADNATVIEGLSKAFADADKPLAVLIECDTGAGRCGVQSPEATVHLAQQIGQSMGLRFAGLMTYPAIGGLSDVQNFMTTSKHLLAESGYACSIISSGGSPDCWRAHEAPIVNEYRVGTYIYNDWSLVNRNTCDLSDCALHVVATIVSVPTPSKAIIDAGSKILTTDLFGLEGHGLVIGHPSVAITNLSEEHGHIDCNDAKDCFSVGDRVNIVPNHACVVSNMVDEVFLVQKDKIVAIQDVAARGKMT